MHLEDATILEHSAIRGGYRLLTLEAPAIGPEVRPGQFVHLQIPHLRDSVLRRPFSVFKVEGTRLSILYKDVGRGTRTLVGALAGETISLIGPLGRPFPQVQPDAFPVLVAGGYGMAALYLVAAHLDTVGLAFFGGAKAGDILCVDAFNALGWEVRVATVDGSLGTRGLVTDALDPWLAERPAGAAPVEFFVCGPNRMLQAVGDRALRREETAWLSVDRNMGCGVGACLTCVLKVRDRETGGWKWERACKEGPVFECRDVVWEDEP